MTNHENYATGNARINRLLQRLDDLERRMDQTQTIERHTFYYDSPAELEAGIATNRSAGGGSGIRITRHILRGNRHESGNH